MSNITTLNRIKYQIDTITESSPTTQTWKSLAPVTRSTWSAEGLPEGVTLSESGVLTGHPTTAGTYDSTVTITTNWGTVTKVIRIVVE